MNELRVVASQCTGRASANHAESRLERHAMFGAGEQHTEGVHSRPTASATAV